MEGFNLATVFSSIDRGAALCLWQSTGNCRMEPGAICGDPSAADRHGVDGARDSVGHRGRSELPTLYGICWLKGMRAKLGLTAAYEGDLDLAQRLAALLEQQHLDYTLVWRRLADAATDNIGPLVCLFADSKSLHGWFDRWRLYDSSRFPLSFDNRRCVR